MLYCYIDILILKFSSISFFLLRKNLFISFYFVVINNIYKRLLLLHSYGRNLKNDNDFFEIYLKNLDIKSNNERIGTKFVISFRNYEEPNYNEAIEGIVISLTF